MTPESELEDTPPPSLLAKIFGISWSLVALLTILSYWQSPHFLNLVSSFRVQLLFALIVLSIPPLFLFPGKKKLLFLGVPAAISITLLSYFVPISFDRNEAESQLSLAVANVYSGNRDISRLETWLAKKPADILVVLEVASHHGEALENLGFKTVVSDPREGNFGIALLSKQEPLRTEILERDTPFPSILAEFDDYQIIATHPIPPLDSELRTVGDEQIERLAKLSESFEKPTIFVGDFNATGWDMRVRPLEDLGLKDSRKGHGLLPTWPVGKPFMYIPIDHIYVPEDWVALDCQRGPDIGSDHFPLSATVQYPKKI